MMAYVWVGTCLLIMTAALTWGFSVGDFWGEGAQLIRLPWGVISVIDVYTGAALFSGWIAFRERSRAAVAAWVLAIILLGNLATSAYALLALRKSRGDMLQFWMGRSRTRG
jgi:hypothetical protein